MTFKSDESEIESTEYRLKSVTFEKDGFKVVRQRSTNGQHVLTIIIPRWKTEPGVQIELHSEGKVGDDLWNDTVLDRAETLRDLLDKAINTEISI